jgi:hypothetical protein
VALELDLGLKAGGVAGCPEALLVEHRSIVKPPQDERGASRSAPLLDLARHIRRPAGSDECASHSSKPSANSSA